MVVMTCHNNHRIRGHLMGLTKWTTDEILNADGTISQRRAQPVPTSLTREAGPFNAINNTLDGYKTNYTVHWRNIKTPLQGRRHYQRKTLTSQSQSQQLESKATYIKPPTLPIKGTDNIETKMKILIDILCYSISFHNLILTLASEVLWQAPHWWSPL